MPFVDLTVCPAYDFAFKNDPMVKYGLEHSKYRSKGHFTPSKNPYKELDLRKVFDDITYDIHELLQSIKILTLDHEHKIFIEAFNESKNSTDYVNIVTKYQSNLGRCYSILPKEEVQKLGVRVIEFVGNVGMYIYLGYPGQFMYHITKTKVINH